MEDPRPLQQEVPTPSQIPKESPFNFRIVPVKPNLLPASQSNAIDESKPWYHLFRPSLLGPNSSPSTQPQSQLNDPHDRSTFLFCQSRLIAAAEDLAKMIQSASSI